MKSAGFSTPYGLHLIFDMDIFSLAVSVTVGIFVIMLIREIKPEYTVIASIFIGSFILLQTVPFAGKLLEFAKIQMGSNINDSYIGLIYKAIGVSFLCQYVSELCRESGLDSISSKTELFGKIYLTLLSLPLIEKIIEKVNIL